MKRNKTLLVLTLILLSSIIITGCGTQAPATDKPNSEPQAQDLEPAPATEAPSVAKTEAPMNEAAPTEAPAEAATTTVSFANDILPIIESRCVSCHGGRRIEEGLLLRTYDEIMAGSDNGPVIIPGDVEGSLLVELVTNQKMPKKGPKLTPPQVQLITDWVAAGAPNN